MKSRRRSGPLRIEWPPYLARLVNYEYWPWYLFFMPLLPVWLYFAFRSLNLSYFTATNPSIPLGGLFGESKSDILKSIPSEFKMEGFKVTNHERDGILAAMAARGINFPVIMKPDVGERGYMVKKIDNVESMHRYLSQVDEDLIIQEFIDLPVELGVLYHRFPDQGRGSVTSVTRKKFLYVTGNGVDPIRELMSERIRSQRQIKRLELNGLNLETIPAKGEEVFLEPIGNHCLGTAFLDGSELLGEELNAVFDTITSQFEGFHYGRFDLKVKSYESLLKGEHIQVFEVNGVTSEPGHIYDPKFTLWQAYRDTIRHMRIVYNISRSNMNRGVHPTPARDVIRVLNQHFAVKKKKKTPEYVPEVTTYISEQI